MKCDLTVIHKEFEKFKASYDFSEYINEIIENDKIINNFNFDEAKQQIMKLTSKYFIEFNILALLYQNGKNVVPADSVIKTDVDMRNDLIYLNNCIPLIALSRIGARQAVECNFSQLNGGKNG